MEKVLKRFIYMEDTGTTVHQGNKCRCGRNLAIYSQMQDHLKYCMKPDLSYCARLSLFKDDVQEKKYKYIAPSAKLREGISEF